MRITDFTELTTPTSNDLLVVVDVVNDITKKLKLSSLPVSTSVTTALATKQDTLVSGTNIKTINSTSLLGSGDIVIAANPSGVAGAIQFSDGSAFASDATNFFWNNTTKRLGVGTNAPSSKIAIVDDSLVQSIFGIKTSQSASTFQIYNSNSTTTPVWQIGSSSPDTRLQIYDTINFRANGTQIAEFTSSEVRVGGATGARMAVRGSGSTSATTSLLVQNSAGTNWLQVKDDGDITNGANGSTDLKFEISPVANKHFRLTRQGVNVDFFSGSAGNAGITVSGTNNAFNVSAASANLNLSNGGVRVGSTYATTNASAQLEVVSTTKGFLPPRMTTTEKNAIATPAAGLVVYDTTTNKLCCYNGSTWNDLF